MPPCLELMDLEFIQITRVFRISIYLNIAPTRWGQKAWNLTLLAVIEQWHRTLFTDQPDVVIESRTTSCKLDFVIIIHAGPLATELFRLSMPGWWLCSSASNRYVTYSAQLWLPSILIGSKTSRHIICLLERSTIAARMQYFSPDFVPESALLGEKLTAYILGFCIIHCCFVSLASDWFMAQ